MKMRLILICFVCTAFFSIGFAQSYDLGEVTQAELQEKVHPKDTSANAAILFKKGRTYFTLTDGQFNVITEVSVKIKIYKKEAYEKANFSLYYYAPSTGSGEQVDFTKAVTYNLVNGQIEKTKAKSENIFTEQVNKNTKVKKLSMPAVKEGCIIEYKYSILSPFISNIRDWFFQYDVPINYCEYVVDIPEYYKFNNYYRGALILDIAQEKVNRSVTFSVGNRFEYFDNRITYKVKDVAAMKEESFVNNISNYRSTLIHEHASTMLPQSTYQYYAKTWEDVCRKIYDDEEFGPQMRKTGYFEADLTKLVEGLTTDDEKIAMVFQYVQNRMNWNESYRIFTDKGVRKAYEEKTGNYAEINLMMVGMLRHLGINAHPILLSTRANGIAMYPSFNAYNAVIVGVKRNGGVLFLDATSKYASPDILPLRDLNWYGRMLLDDGTAELVDLMPKMVSLNQENAAIDLAADGSVSGKVRNQMVDYSALRFRDRYRQLSKESQIERLQKNYTGIEVTEFELADNGVSEALVEKYSFESTNSVEVIGGKMFVRPLFHLGLDENPFKQETREYPIDFSFPFREKQMIIVNLPEGYTIETLPENMALGLDKNYGTFSFSITKNENKLVIQTNLEIKTAIMPPDEYESLKEFFKLIVDKVNEKIVLKKV